MEGYTFRDKCGFKHATLSPYYPQSNAFLERHIFTMIGALSKAYASRVPVAQVLMKLHQALIGPSEILHN